jgi:hypothetical protein
MPIACGGAKWIPLSSKAERGRKWTRLTERVQILPHIEFSNAGEPVGHAASLTIAELLELDASGLVICGPSKALGRAITPG